MTDLQCIAWGEGWGCERRSISRRQLWCTQHKRQVERNGAFRQIRRWGVNHARDDLGRKTCGGCLLALDEGMFSRNQDALDGFNSRCKTCNRKYQMSSKYGLTLDQFEAKLKLQGGCCAACKTVTPGGHGWVVDHDHGCCPGFVSCRSCVRGILCGKCNTALGLVNDSPGVLFQLIRYLEENKV